MKLNPIHIVDLMENRLFKDILPLVRKQGKHITGLPIPAKQEPDVQGAMTVLLCSL